LYLLYTIYNIGIKIALKKGAKNKFIQKKDSKNSNVTYKIEIGF